MDQQQTSIPAVTVEDQKEKRAAFGQMLRDARLRAGMSEEAVAQSTRIARHFIVALESGDFTRLPGNIFGRGFVQSIARTVGGDESAMVAAYQECVSETLRATAQTSSPAETTSDNLKPRLIRKPRHAGQHTKSIRASGPHSTDSRDSASGAAGVSKSVTKWALGLPVGLVLVGLVALFFIGRQNTPTRSPHKDAAVVSGTSASLSTDSAGSTSSGSAGSSAGPEIAAVEAPIEAAPADDDVHQDPPADAAAAAGVGTVDPVAAVAVMPPAPVAAPVAAPLTVPTVPVAEPVATPPAEATTASAQTDLQVLELVVKAAVKLKIGLDGGTTETKELRPDTYRFEFKDRADVMIYDASSVDVAFNGRSLGSLGSKGRIRRLSFAAPQAAQSAMPASRATLQ
jgi:cytoskeletal protein RodZ